MPEYVVITHPDLHDARASIHRDALPEHQLRGWVEVGPSSQHGRLTTDDEQAALDAAQLEQERAGNQPAPVPVKKAASPRRAKPRKATS